MNHPLPQEINYNTAKGDMRIRSFCSKDELRQFRFNPQFGAHAHYKSLFTKRISLEQNAELADTNVTVALADDDLIVGFGVLGYPDPDERWSRLHPAVMMEVKVIEVGRGWRSAGLAKGILELLLTHPQIEEKIAYMVGYSWTWDLDGTRQTAQQYRRMLIRLFSDFAFIEYPTNEPNICLKPENLFMGRLGKNLDPKTIEDFKWIRFGIDSD